MFKKKIGVEGILEFVNLFVVDEDEEEEEAFLFFSYDVDIFILEVNGFEMLNGDFFDFLDFDGSEF